MDAQPVCTAYPDGSAEWHLNGELHRPDGPAIINADGHKEWWVDGCLHRTDGPAIIWSNGDEQWYFHGRFHRADGPAVMAYGVKRWYLNDKQVTWQQVYKKATTDEQRVSILYHALT